MKKPLTLTENVYVREFIPISSPEKIKQEFPLSEKQQKRIYHWRKRLISALQGERLCLIGVIGPCSIHDPQASLEYAEKLSKLAKSIDDKIFVIMRVYFEKPRTTIGWKGLINDPHLDNSYDVERGLRLARELLIQINELGLPCATEFLDPIVPHYIADLVTWAAIGARTTESQTHRQMASGLSMPVGFKNATTGSFKVAVNAMQAATQTHTFLGIDNHGKTSVVKTEGNPYAHIVLRGGDNHPNYEKEYRQQVLSILGTSSIRRPLVIDCSHGNSYKDYSRQGEAFHDVIDGFCEGEHPILGFMLESHLFPGKQAIQKNLKYGVSITDACLGFDQTEHLLMTAFKTL